MRRAAERAAWENGRWERAFFSRFSNGLLGGVSQSGVSQVPTKRERRRMDVT